MYPTILVLHSLIRWLVLASVILILVRSFKGWITHGPYTKADGVIRTVTTSILHLQLLLGLVLYFKSPIITYFRQNISEAAGYLDVSFFGIYHIFMMLLAGVLTTIGASKAKRANSDEAKHRMTVVYFTVGLLIIFLAIPWPFSPFVTRPYFRAF